MYQCPFGLRLHFYYTVVTGMIHMSRLVSMPFRAETPFLLKKMLLRQQLQNLVSMPFRAETPFLRYPFQNLGFMRFLEPVFAGIYQNILTMAIFRAC